MSSRIRGIRQPIPGGTVLARMGMGAGPPLPVKIGTLAFGGLSGTAFVQAHQSNDGSALTGTTTNDNAAAGNIGEYISASVASGGAVPLTTNTAANVTSIALSAGDWDIGGVVVFGGGGTTTVNRVIGGWNTTSATLPAAQESGQRVDIAGFGLQMFSFAGPVSALPCQRLSLAAPTTVYLIAHATFGVSTCSAFGSIWARRRR